MGCFINDKNLGMAFPEKFPALFLKGVSFKRRDAQKEYIRVLQDLAKVAFYVQGFFYI